MSSETRMDFTSIIERLKQRADCVDVDDLGGLAQMHGLCESLAQAVATGTASAPVGDKAKDLTRRLEQLILGEAENAAETLRSIVADVSLLAEAADTPSSDTVPAGSSASTEGPDGSDEDLRAKLEKVFVDDPLAEDDQAPVIQPPVAPSSVAQSAPLDAALAPDEASEQPAYEQLPLTINAKETDFVKGFVEEALEHVSSIEIALLEVERAPEDLAKINSLFRPFHTIKGMAGFLNLRDINCLTHEVETLLDQARKAQRDVTPGLIDLVFDVIDVLKAQISAVAAYLANPTDEPVPQPPVVEMISHLRSVVAGRAQADTGKPEAGPESKRIGDTLVEQGVIAREVAEFAAQQSRPEGPRTGEVLMEMGVATVRQVSQALRPQATSREQAAATSAAPSAPSDQSVRIDTAKLDALVDMVGELVIAQTLVNGNNLVVGDAKLGKDVSQVTKIVRTVQEVVLAMRMIPIGATFQKMGRLVRDVSRKAGKQVELTISGEDTELDKNVIQQISDPLIHMVRNAVDHGIESPEARATAGKSAVGRVHLNACHQGGNIVIEISDDGKGLDPHKLLAKGIERGLVHAGVEMTNEQIYGLIFEPGFSTADTITDISGRGVGMDVVRRNIEQLRGKIEIVSEVGKGTRFMIRLPLTLAIIDGMVVGLAAERFIIPTIALEQALRPTPDQLTTVQHRGEMIQVRGQLIPLIQLGQLFGLTGRVDPCSAMVVIARSENDAVGLVVEELLGQQQVVIKSLGERFRRLRGISGGAILGDGRVGLILEMTGLTLHNATTVIGGRVDRPVAGKAEQNSGLRQPVPSDAARHDASEVVLK